MVAPGAEYKAGGLKRFLLGSNWRELWTTPVAAPVLDPATYAGGLKLDGPGGGRQSIVLHLKESDGWKEYRFRSVDKFPEVGAKVVTGTYLSRLMRDQVSTHFPAAPLLVVPLHRAIGVLHVTPELYVMGDSPRLEQLRDTAAGMLGTMELKASEGPDKTPGFAGSRSIKSTEKTQEELESGRDQRADERELLAIRLMDLLINDSDRTPDNFDWARFGEKGNYTWRPLPRDRDHAFKDARGVVNRLLVKPFYPKQAPFNSKYGLRGLLYGTHQIDRRFLQRLSAEDFADVGRQVQRAISDSVLAEVIATLPATWRERTTEDDRIASVLRARRDQIEQVSAEFYRKLALEVDVFGTNESDRFEVMRHDDGRVTVVITDPERKLIVERRDDRIVATSDGEVVGAGAPSPFYSRTFTPGETKEVRLYALGENDIAIVRGAPNGAIKVRIIGGKGDDFLADSAGGDATFLYDEAGKNILQASDETHVSTAPWKQLDPHAGMRAGDDWKPDWGRSMGWKPAVDYNTGAGVILGFGPSARQYGFRRIPNAWKARATGWVGTQNGRVGVTSAAEYHMENSPRSFRLDAQATQLEATRFFGYGNETPRIDRTGNLVDQTVVSFEPTYVYAIGWRSREQQGNALRVSEKDSTGRRPVAGELRVGSIFGYFDPEPTAGSPLQLSGVRGSEAFGLAGARIGLELDGTDADPIPSRGWTAEVDLAGYPPLAGLDGMFGTATARGTFYVPFSYEPGIQPNLALRFGGSLATGDYPAQFAAFTGGRSTLRGYSYRRFAGDAGANGSAELRIPLGEINVFVRSKVGVFGLADAGRVWFDGASDGGWHTALGGGVWASAFGKAFSLAYAKGESQRLYVKSGLFF